MLIKLILSVYLLIQLGDSYELNTNCAKGPEYWCQSIPNANECNAFKHCLDTVWTKHDRFHHKLNENELNMKLSSPSKCANCIQCFVTDLRRCPIVRDFRNEINELLANDLPARSICELINQCELEPLVESNDALEENNVVINNDKGSIDYEVSASESKKSSSSSSSSSSINDVIELDENSLNDKRFECGLHPRNWCNSIETAQRCNAVTNCLFSWSKSSVNYRAKQLDTSQLNELTIEQINSQKSCGFCIFIFNKLQSVIQQNSTEVNIQNYLTSACGLLPSKEEANKCLEAVNKYLPEIYSMVRDNVDPGIICRVLKACSDKFLEPFTKEKPATTNNNNNNNNKIPVYPSSQLLNDESESVSLKKKLSKIKINIIDEAKVIVKTPLQKIFDSEPVFHKLGSKTETLIPKLAKSNGIGCELCTIVLSATKYLLENKIENEKILGFIQEQLCDRLGSLSTTCKDYIKEEGAQILDLLAKSVDPALLCRGMGLCLKVQVSDQFENNKFFDLNVRNSVNCTLCKMVIEHVKKMMNDNKSQAEIIDYINNNLCEKVGKTKELCKSLIDAYGPLFIEIIARDINPDQVCTMIGMCSKQLEEDVDQYGNNKMGNLIAIDEAIKTSEIYVDDINADATCILCEFTLNLLSKYINNNSTEPQIEKWLEYVCDSVMPVSVRKECNVFISTYGPMIISLLTKQISPDKVCQSIGLCTKSNMIPFSLKPIETGSTSSFVVFKEEQDLFKQKSQQIAENQSTQTNSDEHEVSCTVCQFSIQYLDTQIRIDRTEHAIKFAVDNVCKLSPRTYRPHCQSMVDKYGIKLISIMEQFTEPAHVCHSIKLCKIQENVIENNNNNNNNKQDNEGLVVDSKPLETLTPSKKIDSVNQFVNSEKVSPFNGEKITAKNNSLECSLCIYVAQIVDNLLKQNKTDEQILAELKLVCGFFPNNLRDQCNAFMNEYGPYVLQLIAAEIDPQVACAALKLCESSTVKEPLRSTIIRYNLRP